MTFEDVLCFQSCEAVLKMPAALRVDKCVEQCGSSIRQEV